MWGAHAVFVHTTWPTLMRDLRDRRFDVAFSGITITPERSQAADFSAPYCMDGKTAIVRCADAAKYRTLAQIDQPGVHVIVNPGGTNEHFAREHITHATITVHADNRTIFDEIIAGRADVMITDGIEVRLQTRRHPELCGASAPFTHAQKAILLPPNSELTSPVNEWLAPQIAGGQLTKQLEQALQEAP
jgi:cyclohexadienyl dehydratase